MGTLFIFDGAFGTGKQLVLDYIVNHYTFANTAYVLRKYTVENPKFETNPNISVDLNIVDDEEFDRIISDEPCIYYTFTNQRYAFTRRDLEKSLRDYQNVFVVIRDVVTIQDLKHELGIRAVPVYIYTDPRDLADGLAKKGTTELDQIAYHIDRQELAWRDYLKMTQSLYEEVIINNNKEQDVHDQVNGIIERHSTHN